MKKAFKKSIACLIAALMIFSTLPLTPPISAEAADVSSIQNLTFDKASATAKGYHYTSEATGGYDNILYCSQTPLISNNDYNTVKNLKCKTFSPTVVVGLYDGTTTGFPVVLETKSKEIWYTYEFLLRYISWNGDSRLTLKRPWYGYHESAYKTWPTASSTKIPVTSTKDTSMSQQSTTSRFFNNEIYYNGDGNADTYYDEITGTKYYIDVNGNDGSDSCSGTKMIVLDYKRFYSKVDTVKDIQQKLVNAPNRYTDTSATAAINAIKAYYDANQRVKNDFSNVNDTNAATIAISVATDMKNAVAAINAVNLECAHKTTRVVDAVPATCVSKGQSGTVYCADCDNVKIADSYETEINPKNHKSEVDLPAQDSTCSSTGLTAGKQCTACGVITVAQETVDKKPHTEVIDEAVDPSCTETGLTAGKHCSVCKEVIQAQTVVEALGHDLKDVADSAKDPTCTEAGKYADKKCSRCDYKVTGATIDATGHSYTVKVTAPTCTAQGYTTHTCACGDSYKDTYTNPLGHDMQEVADSAKEPTCTEAGKEADKACSRCDFIEEGATIDAKGHTEVEIPAVDETCTTAGSTAGTKCSVCDVIIIAPETIPAKGHSFKYTYNNDGTHTKACENCDESSIEDCSNVLKEQGTTSDTWHCTVCGHEYERAVANMRDLNSAIVELEALVNADDAAYRYESTALATAKEVIANAKAYAENKDNRYATKEEVDGKIAEVLTAKTKLTENGLAKYTVTFTIANDDTKEDNVASYTVENVPYGETVTFEKERLNGEDGNPLYVVYKWIKIDSNKNESKVNAVSKDFSVVVKESATYICHVLNYSASTEGENATTRVRFIDKSGRTLAISYAELGSAYDLEKGIKDSNVEVPAIPYYDFKEWKCVSGNAQSVDENELVFRATYEYSKTEANQCQIVGLNGALINGSSSYTGYYDERVTLSGGTHFAICNESGDKIIADINMNYIYVPHINAGEKLYITVVETASEEASTAITGYFTQANAGGTTSNGTPIHRLYVNAQYYLPEGATAVEAGFVLSRSATDADSLQIGKDKVSQLVSDSQGANHEYTMFMGFTAKNHAYVRSYLIYLDKDGVSHTVYSDVMRIEYSV